MLNKYERWLHAAELLYLLVLKELKVRYKRSLLGYVWAIANPFAFSLVYWVAFKFIMRVQMENFAVFIITGLFPWAWLNQAVVQGTGSYTNNLSLVKRVNLPKLILPLSNVMQELVHFLLAIPVIYCFIVISDGKVNLIAQIWQIPLMLLLQVLFVFPLTVIGAVCNVYVRDIQYLIGVVFSILFYVTPMVYPLSLVPSGYQKYFRANPIFWLIESWRIIFAGDPLPLENIIYMLLWSAVFGMFAFWIYRRLSSRIAELV